MGVARGDVPKADRVAGTAAIEHQELAERRLVTRCPAQHPVDPMHPRIAQEALAGPHGSGATAFVEL